MSRSFTLLELLVVITIIGILTSIVVVSMSGSTDSANIVKGKAYTQQVQALLGHETVGMWNFDEGSDDTCYDISGYGNDGTINKGANGTGLEWVDSDIEGSALQFDGVDDGVYIGNPIALRQMSMFSVEAWVNFSALTGTYEGRTIFNKGSNGGVGTLWIYYNGSSNRLYVELDKIAPYYSWTPVLGQWYHVLITYNSENIRWYLNGILVKTYASSEKLFNNTADAIIGRYQSSYTHCFNGLIDEVHIYTEALPSTEIQKYYVQGLEKILANQGITQAEYSQRMEEFNQFLVSNS